MPLRQTAYLGLLSGSDVQLYSAVLPGSVNVTDTCDVFIATYNAATSQLGPRERHMKDNIEQVLMTAG